MPWKPKRKGEVPTLGFDVLDWVSTYLAAPDRSEYTPFVPTLEQAQFILNFYALDPLTCRRRFRRAVLSRSKGWGKAESLTTPIATPDGWTSIGDLVVGDQVFDETGAPCSVIAVSPVWTDTDCWRVRFSDGAEHVVSGNHQWTVDDLSAGYESVTVDTRTLAARLLRADGARNWRLPMPGPIECPWAELPLDPYVLGAWLGDGDSAAGALTGIDEPIFDRIAAAGYAIRWHKSQRIAFEGLTCALRNAGVQHDKHVPAVYLRASVAQRLELLHGLMDTDGSIYDRGVCEYSTSRPQIRDGVVELLATLGIKAAVYEGMGNLNGFDTKPKWRIKFTAYADTPVFSLPRKLARQRPRQAARQLSQTRRVVSVERVATVPTRCIEVDSPSHLYLSGRRMVQTHNSPLLAALACVEALAPVVPCGWDARGRPVGRPWSEIRTPWVQLAAVSEDQTRNAWGPLLEMLREGSVLDEYPGLEPMETFVNLPKGRIEFVTSASTSREGNRPIFCVLDQTEEWKTSNGGVKLASTLRRNLGKTNGVSIESPNAYEPGAGSVAEHSAEYAMRIAEGRARDEGLLYDHREWPAETDMADRVSLLAGLAVAYGDSAADAGGWVDLDRIAAEIYDPATNPQDARRYYGNQVTHSADAWISQPEWAARVDATRVIADRDVITIGFDGSRKRNFGRITDATALIGCRVLDGHLFELGVWEQPDGPAGDEWQVPATEVDAAVRGAFKRYRVVGMYADPAKWESYIAGWEASLGHHLKIKASRDHPMEWWMTGGRATSTVRALEQFHSAVIDGELSHDGAYALTRHVLNARRRVSRSGLQIAKEHPESPRKIDAAVAAVLAWQARLDAVAAGHGKSTSSMPKRIR